MWPWGLVWSLKAQHISTHPRLPAMPVARDMAKRGQQCDSEWSFPSRSMLCSWVLKPRQEAFSGGRAFQEEGTTGAKARRHGCAGIRTGPWMGTEHGSNKLQGTEELHLDNTDPIFGPPSGAQLVPS